VSAEEVNFRPTGEGGKERLHPALFTLVLAFSRDPRALASSRRLRQLYEELGLEIGERQLRNHVRWLIEHDYVVLYKSRWGWRVELTERGGRLLRALGLLREARA
jgi:repressor of nif and glnA expression